ncbi:hypothetical protein ES708_11899 [subsurface metagenome]
MKKLMRAFVIITALIVHMPVYAQDTVLMAGIAKTDITPTESLYMGGYDSNMRDKPSDGTFGKIYIRALVFDDSKTKVAFVVTEFVPRFNKT